MIDARFTLALAAFLALAGLTAWPFVARLPGGGTGLVAGLGFSFVSLALGMGGIRWGLARGPHHMVRAFLAAMAARVVALMAFALILVFATHAHLAVGLLTVVAAHLVVGAVEIGYLHRTGAFE